MLLQWPQVKARLLRPVTKKKRTAESTRQEKTTYTPSQRQNETKTRMVTFLDEFIKWHFLFKLCVYLILVYPPPLPGTPKKSRASIYFPPPAYIPLVRQKKSKNVALFQSRYRYVSRGAIEIRTHDEPLKPCIPVCLQLYLVMITMHCYLQNHQHHV